MKKVIAVVLALMVSTSVFAVTKCAPDGRGGVCCWDTKQGFLSEHHYTRF